MAKKKFNFGEVLNQTSKNDKFISFTKEIDVTQIIVNEKNFYGMREIEELAESIKMCGLLHNIVVNELSDGQYLLISGERRFKAYYSLYQEDESKYKMIPCKVLNIEDEDLKQWYLIEGNKQRTKNDYEIMEEVKQRQEYYEKLKSKGYKFGKKTRALISEDIGISETQVQRFKAVESNLSSNSKEYIKEENFNLADIKKVSDQPQELQQKKIDEILIEKNVPKLKKDNKLDISISQEYTINDAAFTKNIENKLSYIQENLNQGMTFDGKEFGIVNAELEKINKSLKKITAIIFCK